MIWLNTMFVENHAFLWCVWKCACSLPAEHYLSSSNYMDCISSLTGSNGCNLNSLFKGSDLPELFSKLGLGKYTDVFQQQEVGVPSRGTFVLVGCFPAVLVLSCHQKPLRTHFVTGFSWALLSKLTIVIHKISRLINKTNWFSLLFQNWLLFNFSFSVRSVANWATVWRNHWKAMIAVYMQRIVWQSNCKMEQGKNEAVLNHIYRLILLWKDLFCMVFLFLFYSRLICRHSSLLLIKIWKSWELLLLVPEEKCCLQSQVKNTEYHLLILSTVCILLTHIVYSQQKEKVLLKSKTRVYRCNIILPLTRGAETQAL